MVVLSVVIPVYNSEKYLQACIDSVIYSMASNKIEILLINDGSRDASAEICNEYLTKYEFVRCIHKKNEGISKTRNRGILEAQGEYVTFIDSDDLFAPTFIADVVNVISEHRCDMYVYEYEDFPCERNNFATICSERNILFPVEQQNGYTLLQQIMTTGIRVASCWGSVYNREFLVTNNISFDDELGSSEDTDFVYNCLTKAQTVQYRNQTSVIYRRYVDGSISNTYSVKKLLADLEVRKKWFVFAKQSNFTDIQFFANDFAYLICKGNYQDNGACKLLSTYLENSWFVVSEGTSRLAKLMTFLSGFFGITITIRLLGKLCHWLRIMRQFKN